jgi:hypothetical protein
MIIWQNNFLIILPNHYFAFQNLCPARLDARHCQAAGYGAGQG